MSDATLRPTTISHVGPRQIAIFVLAVATGLVHLYRGIMTSSFAGGVGRAASGAGRAAGRIGNRLPGGPPVNRPPTLGPSILQMIPVPLSTLFYLNFAGYIILALAYILPPLAAYRSIVRWVLIVYAAVTIIMWYLITGASPNLLAYIDKPIEVALIVLLLIDSRQPNVSRG